MPPPARRAGPGPPARRRWGRWAARRPTAAEKNDSRSTYRPARMVIASPTPSRSAAAQVGDAPGPRDGRQRIRAHDLARVQRMLRRLQERLGPRRVREVDEQVLDLVAASAGLPHPLVGGDGLRQRGQRLLGRRRIRGVGGEARGVRAGPGRRRCSPGRGSGSPRCRAGAAEPARPRPRRPRLPPTTARHARSTRPHPARAPATLAGPARSGPRRPHATKYLASGWWQMMASVVCSGLSWNPSLTVTPMRSPPSSSTTLALSVRSGQAG